MHMDARARGAAVARASCRTVLPLVLDGQLGEDHTLAPQRYDYVGDAKAGHVEGQRLYRRSNEPVQTMHSASLLVTGSALVSLPDHLNEGIPAPPRRAPRGATTAAAAEAEAEAKRTYVLTVTAHACALRACG